MNDILILQQRIAELEQLLEREKQSSLKKDEKIAYLYEQFLLAQQKRFGKSSEAYPGQGELFNEAEEILAQEEAKPETQTISYTRKKPVRKPLPKELPREQIIHDIEDKTCDCCGNELHKMGEDKCEKLVFIPATVKVQEHIRPKYACRHCEKKAIATPIKQAKMPLMPINKGIATPSLLSQIITSKYQSGLPLYRQESMFKQYNIDLSRQTMSQWIMRCATLFDPLIADFKSLLLQQPVIFSDDTTLQVVSLERATSYMWVYGCGTDKPKPNTLIPNIVLYEFTETHVHDSPKNYLEEYQGYMQVDGFEGYARTGATLVGCWAHARRYFIEAKKLQGKKAGKADVVLTLIQKLYAVEFTIKEKTVEEKYRVRQKQSKPILDELKLWLEKNRSSIVGNTKLIKAADYLINQWEKLVRYVEDGRLNIDNNRAERAVKPFVIGRKNWLFSNTVSGAKASATLYSIVETAKANGLVPYDYIILCLEELCQPKPDLTKLLPWNI